MEAIPNGTLSLRATMSKENWGWFLCGRRFDMARSGDRQCAPVDLNIGLGIPRQKRIGGGVVGPLGVLGRRCWLNAPQSPSIAWLKTQEL